MDQVVIIDTGSIDETLAIAARFDACIHQRAWCDDFSDARNAALDAVTCDWVLYIDADERLRLPQGEKLAAKIDPTSIAAFVRFRPKSGYSRYRELRLFRSDPRIRFRGRIHESIWPSIAEISGPTPRVSRTSVEIDHLGYDDDQRHKHPRNLPLLETAVRENPDRIYYWHHLAETLAALGNVEEAESVAMEGLSRVDKQLDAKQLADSSLLLQTLVRLQMDRGENPLELIQEGLARIPDDYALLFFLGRVLLNLDRPGEALEVAARLRNVDVQSLEDGLLAFDCALFREKACELAAIASLRLGQRSEAAAHFAAAFSYAPQQIHFQFKAKALGA